MELSRIEQLENFDNHQIAARAGAVKQLLSRQGLQAGANGAQPVLSGVSPLSKKDLDLLRHPLTRKGKILGKLQGALARTSTPDFNHLRQFCKKAAALYFCPLSSDIFLLNTETYIQHPISSIQSTAVV